MAAISAQHVKVNGQSLGSHILITRFLKGAQRLQLAPTVKSTPMGPQSDFKNTYTTPI